MRSETHERLGISGETDYVAQYDAEPHEENDKHYELNGVHGQCRAAGEARDHKLTQNNQLSSDGRAMPSDNVRTRKAPREPSSWMEVASHTYHR
jgi:hypothetical protein